MNEVEPEIVKTADAVLLATEVRDLMPALPQHWGQLMVRPHTFRIKPWSPEEAEELFLQRFYQLDTER